MQRSVFFVSDSTAITAETVGHSLLAQFEGVEFETVYMPHVDSLEKARELIRHFLKLIEREGQRPIVFGTFADAAISDLFRTGCCLYLELFDTFVGPLSKELGIPPSRKRGRGHALADPQQYDQRINSIHFAMANDDGMRLDNFEQADVILTGVSRSGKTPTCLYLAMHFGLQAANYPLTEEDFEHGEVPPVLAPIRHKLFGLNIDPERLHRIRQERRPNSGYASLQRCRNEVRMAQSIFSRLNIPVLDTTSYSIEEISSRIMEML